MDRRQFLATATAASALPLAGCARVGVGATDLGPPETTTENGDAHLRFGRDDRRLLTFSVMPRGDYGDTGGRIPLRLGAWHAADTHLDSFRVTVRAPAGGDPATHVYLRTPWLGDRRSLAFYHGDEGRAVVLSVDDLGAAGDGTVSAELLLEPTDRPATLPVRVTGEFAFSENGLLGREYRAEGATTVEVGARSTGR